MQAVILSERALGDTDGLFAAAVAHIARKLGRVKPLDADALPADRAGKLRALDEWAGADIDWRGELIRFYEDHIPLHLRPNPGLNGALRALRARGVRIGCWSAGPDEAARIVVHHHGLSRGIEAIAAGGGDAAAQLAADLGAPATETVLVSGDQGELAVAAGLGLATAAPDELAALAAETAVPQ
jgi:phosphoglycolate phosphatase-like HAD superfamily hydrolase